MTISMLTGTRRFNYRTAAVILRDGHVLVCREDDDDYVMLPGGRVEHGEASDVSLVREIAEELQCVGQVGRLLFNVENFFELGGEQFHQIGKYYAVELPPDFPFVKGQPCLVTHDEGHQLTFDWIPVEGQALVEVNLLPRWLRGRFIDLPGRAEHLIIDER